MRFQGKKKYEKQLSIPKPKNEPIVGVIDTQFDKGSLFWRLGRIPQVR